MPGVDFAPDPEIINPAPPSPLGEGRVGNIPTAAQLDAQTGDELKFERETHDGRIAPAGSPRPHVVDTDPDTSPGVQPGNPAVRDWVPDLDKEIAQAEARLAQLRDQKEREEKLLAVEREQAARTEQEQNDERQRYIWELAPDAERHPSVIPDRARPAEEQAVAEGRAVGSDRAGSAEGEGQPGQHHGESDAADRPGRAQNQAVGKVEGPAGPRGSDQRPKAASHRGERPQRK